MYIKEFIKIELDENRYYPIYPKNIQNINYIAIFFYDGFGHIYRSGVEDFIKKNPLGMIFQMSELSINNANNLVYISESYDNSTKKITPEIAQLIEAEDTIELCHRNFIGYAVMEKDNLIDLFIKWKNFIDKKAPFILIYQDDQNHYNTQDFESQQAIEQFIADHTQQK
jgi:hypothetical protein